MNARPQSFTRSALFGLVHSLPMAGTSPHPPAPARRTRRPVPAAGSQSPYAQPGPSLDWMPFERYVSPLFKHRVFELAYRLGTWPGWLMAVMALESAHTFSASIQNRYTRATGLIQFMPATAIGMGTTVEALAQLTPEQQLEWVAKFFDSLRMRGRLKRLVDVYLAVFTPAAVGKPLGHVLYSRGQKAYEQNVGLDRDKDGFITVSDIQTVISGVLNNELQRHMPRMATPIT